MKSVYDYRTEEIRNELLGGCTFYTPNKVYLSSKGLIYFYINTRGWFHILKPQRVKFTDGTFVYYEIADYLLGKDSKLTLSSRKGTYKSFEECNQAISEIEYV